MLPPRGFRVSIKDPPQHVPMWFALGSANLEAGREEEARLRFEKIAASSNERIWWPVEYVRSFYFLGRLCEARGDADGAGANYQRFYELWSDFWAKVGGESRPRSWTYAIS